MPLLRFTSFVPAITLSVGASLMLLGLLTGAGLFDIQEECESPPDSMVGAGYIAPD